jgi:phosphotransferase system HPr (HPr) family protein
MSDSGSAQGTFTISNELGLHFRAAAMVVRTVGGFTSRVTISARGTVADASSVLDILTLNAPRGTQVTIEAEGPDAQEAVKTLGHLIDRHFAE